MCTSCTYLQLEMKCLFVSTTICILEWSKLFILCVNDIVKDSWNEMTRSTYFFAFYQESGSYFQEYSIMCTSCTHIQLEMKCLFVFWNEVSCLFCAHCVCKWHGKRFMKWDDQINIFFWPFIRRVVAGSKYFLFIWDGII